jgi:hypothetical protein
MRLRRVRSMSRRFLVLATLLAAAPLLESCSWIQSSLGWEHARPDNSKTAADLDACKAAARAINNREARITQDIYGGSNFPDTALNNVADPTLARNMNAYAADQRYTRIVDDCMSQQGYGAAPPAGKPAGGTAPPPATTTP